MYNSSFVIHNCGMIINGGISLRGQFKTPLSIQFYIKAKLIVIVVVSSGSL